MEFFRSARNPWGQEVLVGISWDVMWVVLIVAVLFVVAHLVWMWGRGRKEGRPSSEEGDASGAAAGGAATEAGFDAGQVPERVPRHSAAARALHWLMSLAMLTLLITAFLPVVGIRFAWVTIHWIAGIGLILVLLYHVVHATVWQNFRFMWVSPRDLGRGMAEVKHGLGAGTGPAPRSGKYPLDHQLYHHVTALATLAAVTTGVFMMVRVDTPFWTRNPYLLGDSAWGLVYVIHGLSGVSLIGLVVAHVYFAARPEKWWMTWSMIRGWIDREHYLAHHDPARWPVEGIGTGDHTTVGPGPGGGAVLEGAPSARREGR